MIRSNLAISRSTFWSSIAAFPPDSGRDSRPRHAAETVFTGTDAPLSTRLMVVRTPLSPPALTFITLFAVIFALTGCATEGLSKAPGSVRVVAPAGKCWSGSIGDSSHDGCGTRTIQVTDESIIVGVVQKKTPGRWLLQLELRVNDTLKDTAETSAVFGLAEVSEG